MRDKRVSVIPINKRTEDPDDPPYTIGMCYLSDIFLLFKLNNFWEFLTMPVISFLQEVNFELEEELPDESS